jgi:hypothetical protein
VASSADVELTYLLSLCPAGGYAGYSEEMCIMLLHYYPRNALLRGCLAVTEEQGGHSMCMYEGASVLAWQNSESNRVPIR